MPTIQNPTVSAFGIPATVPGIMSQGSISSHPPHHSHSHGASYRRERAKVAFERRVTRLEDTITQATIDLDTIQSKTQAVGDKLAEIEKLYGPLPDLKTVYKAQAALKQ